MFTRECVWVCEHVQEQRWSTWWHFLSNDSALTRPSPEETGKASPKKKKTQKERKGLKNNCMKPQALRRCFLKTLCFLRSALSDHKGKKTPTHHRIVPDISCTFFFCLLEAHHYDPPFIISCLHLIPQGRNVSVPVPYFLTACSFKDSNVHASAKVFFCILVLCAQTNACTKAVSGSASKHVHFCALIEHMPQGTRFNGFGKWKQAQEYQCIGFIDFPHLSPIGCVGSTHNWTWSLFRYSRGGGGFHDVKHQISLLEEKKVLKHGHGVTERKERMIKTWP